LPELLTRIEHGRISRSTGNGRPVAAVVSPDLLPGRDACEPHLGLVRRGVAHGQCHGAASVDTVTWQSHAQPGRCHPGVLLACLRTQWQRSCRQRGGVSGGRPRPVKQQVSRPRPRPPAEASHARQSARSISRLLSPRARLGQDLTICSIGPSRHPVNSFQQCQIRENLALCRFLLPHFRVLSCGAADRIPPVAGHTTKPWLLVARKD
jgi:hypothetical protein